MRDLNLEIFQDPSYFDMWCLRRVGCKDFTSTIHFNNEVEAKHAAMVIRDWLRISDAEISQITGKSVHPKITPRAKRYMPSVPKVN